jgi:hypothetical protein
MTLFFGYTSGRNSISQTIEVTEKQYLSLFKEINKTNKHIVSNSKSVLSDEELYGADELVTPSSRTLNDPTTTYTSTLSTSTLNTYSEFEKFWENYPKKINKKLSMVAFGKLGKVDAKLATEDCKVRFVETEKQYIPNPTTYLNGERWNDELADGVAKEKKGYYSGVKWQ